MPDEREKIILQLKGFDAAHYSRTDAYARKIDRLCRTVSSEYAALAGTLFQPDLSKPFSFDDYPQAKKEAARITQDLAKGIEGVVIRGTEAEWKAACDKNDAFLKSILHTSRLTPEEAAQYQARNLEALQSFQQRKVEGLGLSQRVWKYVDEVKETIELGIDVGLGEGRSAQQLSRDLRQCLREPDRLFRRVRDKYGNLRLSKAAKLYHPGRGVYRSSARNAERLARTEVNMAYRTSEYLRWQQLDFVVGIRIQLSNNHTVLDSKGNPQPLIDICDALAGDYPKTFHWVGWHPQCRCLMLPILADYDEYNRNRANRLKAIVKGTAYKSMPSRKTVAGMPGNFTGYIEGIRERAKGWKSQPYYIRDNFKGGTIEGGLKAGVAIQLNTATTKDAVKNNTQPCTEYDGEIGMFKRWAYALGLDVSKLDALRLQGNKQLLRAELDSLQALADNRRIEWMDAINDVGTVQEEARNEGFADINDYCTRIVAENRCVATKYYADCIARLKAGLVTINANIQKAKAARGNSQFNKIIDSAKNSKVTAVPVRDLAKKLSEDDIIKRISGADRTKGSCSSLAFAFAANKGGLDVLDFRGGKSQEFFANSLNIQKIAKAVGGTICKDYNGYKAAKQLLGSVQDGKRYYFASGEHAAIIRKKGTGFEYLELQSSKQNGWKTLTNTELKTRFGTKKSRTIAGMKLEQTGIMIETELLTKSAGFKDLMGFINTKQNAQNKGAGGGIK